MSIRIDTITRGRFGNKILQYNNLIQLSKSYNVDASCVNFPETKYFDKIISHKKSQKSIKDLSYAMVLDNEKLDFNKFSYKIDDPNYLLHNVFFNTTKIDPRNFIKLKEKYKVKMDKNVINVGIHFRGGDKHRKCPHEIFHSKYYIDSIKKVLSMYDNALFILCTDDNNFKTFKDTINFLKKQNINYKLGPNTQNNKNDKESNDKYIYDFTTLSECDILICSSSTFVIAAAFLEKSDKKLIFSKVWLDKNINHIKWGNYSKEYTQKFWQSYDNFWIKLANGGNKYLKPWLII